MLIFYFLPCFFPPSQQLCGVWPFSRAEERSFRLFFCCNFSVWFTEFWEKNKTKLGGVVAMKPKRITGYFAICMLSFCLFNMLVCFVFQACFHSQYPYSANIVFLVLLDFLAELAVLYFAISSNYNYSLICLTFLILCLIFKYK